MAARRTGRWPPPPPTPRVLNLPRRHRSTRAARPPRRNLAALIEQERRERVEADPVEVEDDWRFQAEILRSECNLLRVERELAVRKMDRNRRQMESFFKSTAQDLTIRREKIDGDEMAELEEKLRDLRRRGCWEFRKGFGDNFDRHASTLRRRLERLREEPSEKEIREIEPQEQKCRFPDVEMLRRRMEGVSKGMLEKVVEEYGLLLFGHNRQTVEEEDGDMAAVKQEALGVASCDYCKEVVGRVVQQVRAETEQWNEMHVMLEQVKQEMEELQVSRDIWQRRAVASDRNLRAVHAQMLEWQLRARSSENKISEQQKQIAELQIELQTLRSMVFNPETRYSEQQKARSTQQRSLDLQREKEKHVLVCRLKNRKSSSQRRLPPLRDIGNLPPLARQRQKGRPVL